MIAREEMIGDGFQITLLPFEAALWISSDQASGFKILTYLQYLANIRQILGKYLGAKTLPVVSHFKTSPKGGHELNQLVPTPN